MTEQIANVSSDVDNAHTVEVFLSALQDEGLRRRRQLRA